MQPTEPLALHHSWPIAGGGARFDLGLDLAIPDHAGGRWSCDLADQALTWDDHVFALFGFPAGPAPLRADSVACYRESSRAAMERLRTYAIRHRRGFTIDVEITPVQTNVTRWIRLSAAPVLTDRAVTRLAGTKRDVTALYRPR